MSDNASEARLRLEDEIERIRDRLIGAAIEPDPDGIGWVSVREKNGRDLELYSGLNLYDGQLGIALFFAALARARGDRRAREIAGLAVSPWLESSPQSIALDDNGGIAGTGSVIYTLSKLSAHLEDDRYRDTALELARSLDTATVTSDQYNDVVLGNAGLLLSLLTLTESTRCESIERLVIEIGDHLLDERRSVNGDQRVWTTVEDSPSTGFAHGAAGIAYALFRLANRTGNDGYRRAAIEATEYENGVHEGLGEPISAMDRATADRAWEAWCWGRPGIALARAASVPFCPSLASTLRDDARRVVRGFDWKLQPEDGLCHGTFGSVDVLVEVDRQLPLDCHSIACTLAVDAIERRDTRGYYSLPNAQYVPGARPSLFLGEAGIGYALLRLLYPDELSCVLALQ